MKGKTKKITAGILTGTIFALLGWETYTLVNDDTEDTISESVWRASNKLPVIPFLAGFLMGHFFWPGGVRRDG